MKYLSVACVILLLIGCSPRNEHYYQTHPQALQDALQSCAAKQPTSLSCEQLTRLAVSINNYVIELKFDPQGFGRKILALQQTIASQKAALKTKAEQPELKASLERNKLLLEEYLAIEGWKASPES